MTDEGESSSGRFTQIDDTDGRSSDYVSFVTNEGTHGFTLTKATNDATDQTTVNYTEADGQSSSSGNYSSDSKDTTDTLSHVTGSRTDGNVHTSFSSLENTGSISTESSSGTFREGAGSAAGIVTPDGTATTDGTGTVENTNGTVIPNAPGTADDSIPSGGSFDATDISYSSSRSTTSSIRSEPGNFFVSNSTVTTAAVNTTDSRGSIRTENGDLTARSVDIDSDQFARVNSQTTYFGSTTAGDSRTTFSGGTSSYAQVQNNGSGTEVGFGDDIYVSSNGSFENSTRVSGDSRVSGSFNGDDASSTFSSNNNFRVNSSETGNGTSSGSPDSQNGSGTVNGDSSAYQSANSTVRTQQSGDNSSSSTTLTSNSSSNTDSSFDGSTSTIAGITRVSGSYQTNGSNNANSNVSFSSNSQSADDQTKYWSSGNQRTISNANFSSNGSLSETEDSVGGETSNENGGSSSDSSYTVSGSTRNGSSHTWDHGTDSQGVSSSGFRRTTNETDQYYNVSSSQSSQQPAVTTTSELRYSTSGKSVTQSRSHDNMNDSDADNDQTTTTRSESTSSYTVAIDNNLVDGILTNRSVELGRESNSLLTLEVDSKDETRTSRRGEERDSTTSYSTGGGFEELTIISNRKETNSYEDDTQGSERYSSGTSAFVPIDAYTSADPSDDGVIETEGHERLIISDNSSTNTLESGTFYTARLNSSGEGRYSSRDWERISSESGGSAEYDNALPSGDEHVEGEASSYYSTFTSRSESGRYGHGPTLVTETSTSERGSSYEYERGLYDFTNSKYSVDEKHDESEQRVNSSTVAYRNGELADLTTTSIHRWSDTRRETKHQIEVDDQGSLRVENGRESGSRQFRSYIDDFETHEYTYSVDYDSGVVSGMIFMAYQTFFEQTTPVNGTLVDYESDSGGSGGGSGGGDDSSDGPDASYSPGPPGSPSGSGSSSFSQRAAFNGNGGGEDNDDNGDDNNGDGNINSNDPTPQNLLNDFYNSTNDATREWLDGLPPEGRQAVGEELHRRHLKAAEEQRQRNAPQIGPCNHALVQWAFQDENNDNPLALEVRSEYRGFMGTFFPPGVNHPRRDTQMVFEGFGYIPGVGVGASGVNSLIYGYNGEYGQAFGSALGAGANGLGSRFAGRFGSKFGGRGPTLPNTTKGWKVGDPINNLTRAGNVPSWSAVRQRFWKNEAFNNAQNYSAKNLERMKRGLAPQRINPNTGKLESMELHHTPPQCEGGLFDVEPVWPDEHALIDPYRHTGN